MFNKAKETLKASLKAPEASQGLGGWTMVDSKTEAIVAKGVVRDLC